MTREEIRLQESEERRVHWKRWGPYLSERAWGTVREDYSRTGDAWGYFPHDHARSRAYRWSEDGLAGICDRQQRICFAIALWNGRDPILKERLFGLGGNEGRHGEDVKEYYFYLDSTPTHSYMKYLYKYPQEEFPYLRLLEGDRQRSRMEPEYELLDTGVFEQSRYFDVLVEYAKAEPEDILIRVTVTNRAVEGATLDLLPTIWFRNTWAWGIDVRRPRLWADHNLHSAERICIRHFDMPERWLLCEDTPELLFTENESNLQRLYGITNHTRYVKDGINDYVVGGAKGTVNPELWGSKASARYRFSIGGGDSVTVKLRLTPEGTVESPFGAAFEKVFGMRAQEADEFYQEVAPRGLSEDAR